MKYFKFIFIAFLAVITAFSSCTRIDAGHEGIKVNLYGSNKGVDNVELCTGMVWFNPVTERVYEYPTFVQTVDYDPFTINAKDGSEFTVDPTLSIKMIDGSSPAIFKKYRKSVEDIINNWINEDINQNTEVMNIEMAKKSGAMALFGEKYDDNVRVVKFGNISSELCGGTHVSSTGKIRLAKIVSESAVAAGTRRIEAVCGNTALKFLGEKSDIIDKMTQAFKCPVSELGERIMKLAVDNKNLQLEVENLKAEQAKTKFQSFVSKAQDVNGGKLFITQMEAYPANLIKLGSELLASKLGESIIILASVDEDKITYVVKISDSFVKKGINAGQIVNKLASQTGGKGGGRPQYAQGAGKDKTNLISVLSEIEKEIKQSL